MRILIALAMAGGCNSLIGAHTFEAADAAALGDARSDDAANLDASSVRAAPFALSGLRWLQPCIANVSQTSNACTCPTALAPQAVTIGDTGGTRWHVTFRIRGVMSRMSYTGGSSSTGGWYVGGQPGNNANDIFELAINSPPAVYYINNGAVGNQQNSWTFDYTATVDVSAMATVTFTTNGQDGLEWKGVDANGTPISIPAISDPPQPYNGEFARLDVIDAVAF